MVDVKKIVWVLFFLPVFSCKEKYTPALNSPVTGYLVVEGFINSGTGPTSISLSRTTNLSVTGTTVHETKANVRVEGKNNTTGFLLSETTPGVYANTQLSLSLNDQYRIHIKTTDGKEYVSDYSDVRSTPDIDSVYWRRESGGVQVYADTHDPANKTIYYQYKYDETWEFHSMYTSTLKLLRNAQGKITGVGYKDSATLSYDSLIYKCWQSSSLSGILLASSEKLTQDVIALQRISYIEPASWKLGVLYSVNLKQYALSQKNYRFLEQLKKNTEQLGTVFDAQPSDNNGNIHCVTNPSDLAIGFVEVSQEKQKRIFISNAQIPDWRYLQDCMPESSVNVSPDSLAIEYGMGFIPTNPLLIVGSRIASVSLASLVCVDCTLRGTNIKPLFWP